MAGVSILSRTQAGAHGRGYEGCRPRWPATPRQLAMPPFRTLETTSGGSPRDLLPGLAFESRAHPRLVHRQHRMEKHSSTGTAVGMASAMLVAGRTTPHFRDPTRIQTLPTWPGFATSRCAFRTGSNPPFHPRTKSTHAWRTGWDWRSALRG